MKIGVFDSGVGGLSVANAIQKAFPDDTIILKEDTKNIPYGDKTPDHLFTLVMPILETMVREGCEVIVVACNTVTTSIIGRLREKIAVPLLGMEPMVKPAALATKSGVIAVCATPTTLASNRYTELKNLYAENITVVEPDCSNWSKMIERKEIDETQIQNTMQDVLKRGADVVVLGCTHYHWIEDFITSLVQGKAVVLQPEQPVIKQLKRVIDSLQPSQTA